MDSLARNGSRTRPGLAALLALAAVLFAAAAPAQAESWYSRGMELHEDGRYDRAIAAFKKSIDAGEKVEAATYNIACGYALKGDSDRAFEWLGKAIDAGFDVYRYLDDDDLDALHDDPRWAELKRRARASHGAGDAARVRKAVSRFDRLMAASPRNGRALFDTGKELLRTAEYDRAARAFEAAAATGVREGTSLYNAACARALAGQKEEAFSFLRRALDAGFDSPGTMEDDDDLESLHSDPRFKSLLKEARELSMDGVQTVGSWLLRSERVATADEAAARFELYLKTHPQSGRAYSNLGLARLRGEKPREAADAYRRALDLGYRKPVTMYNLACAHALLGEKDKAFDWLNRSIDAGFAEPDQIRHDDDLDALRGDPRYRQALAKAKAAAAEDDED